MDEFLAELSRGREIFALQAGEEGQYHLVRTEAWDAKRLTLGAFRPIEPLKSIFFQPREFLGFAFKDDEPASLPERIVIGVKNCDLAGLRIQDHMFAGLPPADPGYVQAREKTIVVTCDCTDCLDVCFCPVVDEKLKRNSTTSQRCWSVTPVMAVAGAPKYARARSIFEQY